MQYEFTSYQKIPNPNIKKQPSNDEGKKKIINTFINAIYAHDDHIKIVLNASAKEQCVSLDEIESSTSFSSNSPQKTGHQKVSCFFMPLHFFLFVDAYASNNQYEVKRGLSPPLFCLSSAATGNDKKRDKKKPNIVVVKKIAKAVIHKCSVSVAKCNCVIM